MNQYDLGDNETKLFQIRAVKRDLVRRFNALTKLLERTGADCIEEAITLLIDRYGRPV